MADLSIRSDGSKPRAWTLRTFMITVAIMALLLVPVRLARSPLMANSLGFAISIFATAYGRVAAGVGLAAAVVVMLNCAWSGRIPRPAEWLALTIGFDWIDAALQQNGSFGIALLSLTGPAIEVGGYLIRLTSSSIAWLLIVVCLALLQLFQRSWPVWAKIAVLAVAGLAVLWGPLRDGLGLIASSLAKQGNEDRSWLIFITWGRVTRQLERFPWIVAAVATWLDVRSRDHPPWRLTEWAGLAAASLLVLSGLLSDLGGVIAGWPGSARPWLNRLIGLVFWVILIGLGFGLVHRFREPWIRWLAPTPAVLRPGLESLDQGRIG